LTHFPCRRGLSKANLIQNPGILCTASVIIHTKAALTRGRRPHLPNLRIQRRESIVRIRAGLAALFGCAFGIWTALAAVTPLAGQSVGDGATTPAVPPRVAVIAFQVAVAQTEEGKKAFADLQAKYKPDVDDLKARTDEIDRLKKQLASGQLASSERESQQRAIDEKEAEEKKLAEDKQQLFQADMQAVFNKVAQKVFQLASRYAEQHGFTVLIDVSTTQSSILYASKSMDITQPVINAYNGSENPAPGNVTASSAAPTRIALIEFQDAVESTGEGKSKFQALQAKYSPTQDQLKAENDEIERLKTRIQSEQLSDAERASIASTIESKQKHLQRETEDAKDDFQADMQDAYNKLAAKIYDSLSSYAIQNGYGLVIDKAVTKDAILWSAGGITPEGIAAQGTDITATMIRVYDSRAGSGASVAQSSAPPPSNAPPNRGFEEANIPPSAASSSRVPIPNNYALIFATDDYTHWPHLTNPIPDADALNQTLTSLYNFRVEEVRNPTNEQILAKLTDYRLPYRPHMGMILSR